MKKLSIALVLFVTAGPSFAGRYEITEGDERPFCKELVKALNYDPSSSSSPPLCLWDLRKVALPADTNIRLPNWRAADPNQYWDLLRTHFIAKLRKADRTLEEVQERWEQEMVPITRRQIMRNALDLQEAMVDIDQDGIDEHVFRTFLNQCANTKYPSTMNPQLIVGDRQLSAEGHITANPDFSSKTSLNLDLFYFKEVPYLSFWHGPEENKAALGQLSIFKFYRTIGDPLGGVGGAMCEIVLLSK